MKLPALIFCSFLLLFGCIKEVDSDFNYQSKILVNVEIRAFKRYNYFELYNNSPLSDSIPNFQSNKYAIKNGTIYISDEFGNTHLISYNPLSYYGYENDSNDFKFLEGRKYFISVNTPDGRKANSSMVIPIATEISAVSFDTSSTTQILPNYMVKRSVNFSLSIIGSGKFNAVNALVFYTLCYKNKSGSDTTISSISGTGNSDYGAQYFKESTIKLSTNIYDYADSVDYANIYIDSITYAIETRDNTQYEYSKSIKAQQVVSSNPFAEPVLIYSNIDNGLGVFYGVSQRSKTVKFK